MANTIRVIAAPADATVETKGLLTHSTDAVMADIDLQVLKQNLHKLIKDIGELLAKVPSSAGVRIKQVTAGIELSANGGVTLIGTLTAGAKAAISLTFERE